VRNHFENMAFARTIEDISRDLNEVKDEIKQVKLDIANPKSDADRVQDKIRLNHLYDKEKNLEKGRMFPPCLLLSVSLIAHSCRLRCFFFASLFGSFSIGVAVERAQGNAAGGSSRYDQPGTS